MTLNICFYYLIFLLCSFNIHFRYLLYSLDFTNWLVSNNLNILEVFFCVNLLTYLKYTGSFLNSMKMLIFQLFTLWGLKIFSSTFYTFWVKKHVFSTSYTFWVKLTTFYTFRIKPITSYRLEAKKMKCKKKGKKKQPRARPLKIWFFQFSRYYSFWVNWQYFS